MTTQERLQRWLNGDQTPPESPAETKRITRDSEGIAIWMIVGLIVVFLLMPILGMLR